MAPVVRPSSPLGAAAAAAPMAIAVETSPSREARFTALFDAHHDAVWRSLRRFGVPDAHVDDATQQVFIVLARRLDDVRAGEERNYLYGVAVRVAAQVRRSDPARRFPAKEDALDALAAETNPVDEQMIDREKRAALDDALAGMPDDLRHVLVLVEIEGFTVADVANILDVPAGTAASRLRRAREAFSESARRVRARLAGGAR